MATVLCFENVQTDDGKDGQWRPVDDPPFLAERSGLLVAELPAPAQGYPRAFVNGLEVVAGIQLVRPGDLVRITLARDRSVSYVVGRPVPAREAGDGRPCAFTGLPIRGQAVRCTCGLLMAVEAVDQIDQCPQCARQLKAETEANDWPPEELL